MLRRPRSVGVAFALALSLGTLRTTAAQEPAPPPDVVLINLDDADWDLLSDANLAAHFPNIERWFRDDGLRFTNLHVADPLCGPSRGSLFRGQYPHNTGIVENRLGWEIFHDRGYTDAEIGMWMREAGYRTGLVGKYCHEEYPAASGDNGFVPPGWGFFHASLGGNYFSVARNIQGVRGPGPAYPDGYRTDLETASTRQFLANTDGPLFLYLAPFAPHTTDHPAGMVAPRHADLYADIGVPRTPDFDEADISDKASQFQVLPRATPEIIDSLDELYRNRLRAMTAVDELVGELFAGLAERGAVDSTYVMLTSDNGYSIGHHRDVGKRSHFDRSTRVPFFIRGPGIERGSANHLLSHIDIPATILDLAGAPLPHFLDGRSFAPLLDDPTVVADADWQEAVLVENVSGKSPYGDFVDLRYQALRRYDDVYVEFDNGQREYYDLVADPAQLDNAVDDLAQRDRRALSRQLRDLVDCAGPACQGGQPIRPVDTSLDLADGAALPGRSTSMVGTATARAGVDRVEVVIRHVATRTYWDGTEWSDDYHWVPAVLDKPRTPTATRWSLRLTDLRAGAHWVSARAVDTAGNEDPTIPTAFLDAPADTTPPSTTITTPTEGERLDGETITTTGSATDDVGVDRVEIVVEDVTNGRWWNGTTWQPTYARVAADVSGPQADRTWSVTYPAPAGQANVYGAALAWDTAGNQSPAGTSVNYLVGEPDTTAPEATILSPTDGAIVTDPTTTVTGTATDDTAIDRVELVIKDTTTNQWWNGTTWQPTYTRVTADTTGPTNDQTWTHTYPTPTTPTNIYTAAWAWDTLGNVATPVAGGDFVNHLTGNGAPPDTVAPETSILSPTDGAIVTDPTTTVTGTATDDTAIDRVELVIKDTTTNQWWNGTTWQPTYTRVTADTTGPTNDQTWTHTYPTPTTPTNIYTAAWAWDTLGNDNGPPTSVMYSTGLG